VVDFFEKSEELIRLINADHVPPGIKSAVSRFSECQTKLFCWMVKVEPAFGATEHHSSFEASNFLCELVEAARAFDWPRVIRAIHRECPSVCVSESFSSDLSQ
jgi:hypothetical protein